MERTGHDGAAAQRVKELRNRITQWRRTRARRTRMPSELWAGAVALARIEGTYPIARRLRVDYQALARRVAEAGGERTGNGNFIEIRGADLLGGATVVEVAEADGARLMIRLGGGSGLDVAALVGAFRRRGG
jgi:hypothetical protein